MRRFICEQQNILLKHNNSFYHLLVMLLITLAVMNKI